MKSKSSLVPTLLLSVCGAFCGHAATPHVSFDLQPFLGVPGFVEIGKTFLDEPAAVQAVRVSDSRTNELAPREPVREWWVVPNAGLEVSCTNGIVHQVTVNVGPADAIRRKTSEWNLEEVPFAGTFCGLPPSVLSERSAPPFVGERLFDTTLIRFDAKTGTFFANLLDGRLLLADPFSLVSVSFLPDGTVDSLAVAGGPAGQDFPGEGSSLWSLPSEDNGGDLLFDRLKRLPGRKLHPVLEALDTWLGNPTKAPAK